MNRSDIPAMELGKDSDGSGRRRVAKPYSVRIRLRPASSLDALVEHMWDVWQLRWLVVLSCLIGILSGVVYLMWKTPVFRASATFEVLPLKDAADTFRADPMSLQTHVMLLNTGSFRNSAFDRLRRGLAPEAPPSAGLFSAVNQPRGLRWNPQEFAAHAAKTAATTLRVVPINGSRFVFVSCESQSPKIASQYLNLLLEEYLAYHYKTGAAGASALEQAPEKQQRLNHLLSELAAAQAERVRSEARYLTASSQSLESLPAVISDSAFQELQERLQVLRRELADLNLVQAPASEEVRRAERRVAEAEARLGAEHRRILQSLKSGFELARRREARANAELARQTGVDVTRGTAGQDAEGPAQEVIRVVDSPIPPRTPVSPEPQSTVLMGFGVGLLLANALIFWKQRNISSGVGQAINALVLRDRGVAYSRVGTPWQTGPFSQRRRKALPPGKGHEPTALRESMRMVLTALVMKAKRERRAQASVVSSPNRSEGKTTLTYHMGMALAAGTGFPTLVIDGDCYRGQLHQLFRVSNGSGWSNLISSPKTPVADEINGSVRKTSTPHLSLLCAGTATDRRVVDPARIREILAVLKKKYRFILIDMPPVLLTADARLVATEADGVILVLRTGITPNESAILARQQVAEDGTSLVGIIMNDFVHAQNSLPKYSPRDMQ